MIRLILSRVQLSVSGDVVEEDAHASVLGPDVPVHVRDLLRVHVAVRALEPRSPLAAAVAHVPTEVRFPRESARAVRAAEPLRPVPPDAETAANCNRKRRGILAHGPRKRRLDTKIDGDRDSCNYWRQSSRSRLGLRCSTKSHRRS